MKSRNAARIAAVGIVGAMVAAPAYSHHSFAMYDQSKIRTFTGVVTRVHPDANHLQIFFVPMNDERNGVIRGADGEPEVWAVEMDRAVAAAQQGITVNDFPRGTIFSVAVHPLRSGDHAGGRTGGLFRCPKDTPPAAGKHCDSVEGNTSHGAARRSDVLPASTPP